MVYTIWWWRDDSELRGTRRRSRPTAIALRPFRSRTRGRDTSGVASVAMCLPNHQ